MTNNGDKQEYVSEARIALQEAFGLVSRATLLEEWKKALAEEVNRLIHNDFTRLVGILYRLDVSETRLKHLLRENPSADAAVIITDLIIERQLQKIRTRKQFRSPESGIDENEKW